MRRARASIPRRSATVTAAGSASASSSRSSSWSCSPRASGIYALTTGRQRRPPAPPHHRPRTAHSRAPTPTAAPAPIYKAAWANGKDIPVYDDARRERRAGRDAHPEDRVRHPAHAARVQPRTTPTGFRCTCPRGRTTPPGGSRRPTSASRRRRRVAGEDRPRRTSRLTVLHNGQVDFETDRRDRLRPVPHADRHLLHHRPDRPASAARHRLRRVRVGLSGHSDVLNEFMRRRRPDRDPRHRQPG